MKVRDEANAYLDSLYQMEESGFACVPDPSLKDFKTISIRDNDEARLMLGLELGRFYTIEEVKRVHRKMRSQVVNSGRFSIYINQMLDECYYRLWYFDPDVISSE